MSRQVLVARCVWVAAIAVLLSGTPVPGTLQAQSSPDFVPVTDAMLQNPSPDDWLMWRRTLDGWGYSPLDQIDRDNVGTLRMVWSRAVTGGKATPLVYDGVLYMPQSSDLIQALDAVTGDLKWEYRRDLPDDVYEYVGGNARNNRNIAIYDRFIINTSDDTYVFGLDATTGKVAWETKIFDYQETPAGHSSGPIIAAGKVISGRSCRPRGGPESCVLVAHDARTGAELWRTSTIARPGEPGDETWGGVPFEKRLHVGSWMPPSYDPQLRLIYQGTSVTSPAPKFLLGGTENTHLYHNSTLALDVDTGEIKWYYQHLNDHWDLDHPFERILVDTAVAPNPDAVSWINPRIQPGEVRKVITGIPGKTGVVYTLDRETGEFLWATPHRHAERHQRHRRLDGRRDRERGGGLHRVWSGSPGVSDMGRREGLGSWRLQPTDQHDVHAVTQNLRAHVGHRDPRRRAGASTHGRWSAAACDLRTRRPPPDRTWDRPARDGIRHLGGDGRDHVAPRTAGRDRVTRGHGRWARVWWRCQRTVQGLRPGDGRGAVGDQPRFASCRLSSELRRRRTAVRGREHRRWRRN